jgi:twitching motility protein PilT
MPGLSTNGSASGRPSRRVEITELLRHTVEVGASDLHLKAGNVPFVRVDGELSPTAFGAMSAADTESAALAVMPEHKRRVFEATSEADFGYTLAGVGRFRVNVFRSDRWSGWRSGECARRSRPSPN